MVTIPLKNYLTVPVEPLAGKIVIDTNNYYLSVGEGKRDPSLHPRIDEDDIQRHHADHGVRLPVNPDVLADRLASAKKPGGTLLVAKDVNAGLIDCALELQRNSEIEPGQFTGRFSG